MAGALEGEREHTLVFGAGPGLAAGLYLAAIRDIAAEPGRLLVVDGLDLVDAEGANTTASEAAAAAAAAAAWAPPGALRPGVSVTGRGAAKALWRGRSNRRRGLGRGCFAGCWCFRCFAHSCS